LAINDLAVLLYSELIHLSSYIYLQYQLKSYAFYHIIILKMPKKGSKKSTKKSLGKKSGIKKSKEKSKLGAGKK